LLFFRQIGDSKLHFGLPPRSNNVSVMKRMAKSAPIGILLSNLYHVKVGQRTAINYY